jgi:hypothetical protein
LWFGVELKSKTQVADFATRGNPLKFSFYLWPRFASKNVGETERRLPLIGQTVELKRGIPLG